MNLCKYCDLKKPFFPLKSAALRGRSFRTKKEANSEKTVGLAGNPNVGKSTVFNALTGLNQHTGNWPGKTVQNAKGHFTYANQAYALYDLPGTYSLIANSAEEEVARDFICFSRPDVTVVVADATCLERSLNLVLQVLEITPSAVLCVNLMDEAKKKGLTVDLARLSKRLRISAVGASARSGAGLKELLSAVSEAAAKKAASAPPLVSYGEEIELAISFLEPLLTEQLDGVLNARWVALRLLEGDESILSSLFSSLGENLCKQAQIAAALTLALDALAAQGIDHADLRDKVAAALIQTAEAIAQEVLTENSKTYRTRDARIDRILTSRLLGYPLMLLLLFFVLWLTISGANAPSALLSEALFSLMAPFSALLAMLHVPSILADLLVNGVYKTLAWVVSVMLPPMAIFFPLFTILEDWGYLPRVAFNLDGVFRKAGAHGKQALTTCMGFGCNACGVTGCRIIDSPRERLIATITNNFVPCNGRFPLLIVLISLFFANAGGGTGIVSALMLTALLVLGILATLASAKLLSKTLLRGVPSSFQLELPPYRRPQFGKVLLRSLLDRTVFVLGRAVAVSAPAGAVLWLLANIRPEGVSLLVRFAAFFDPFAHLMGMDGYILLAFILALPANEIVIPLILMGYTAASSLADFENLASLRAIFVAHGWTNVTALCVMLFSLFHWPCATTLFTIKKETNSLKWTLVSLLLPTIWGIAVCMLVNAASKLF